MLSCFRNRLTLKVIALSAGVSFVGIIVLALVGIRTASAGIETHTRLHMASVAELKGQALNDWAESLLSAASTYVSSHETGGNGQAHTGLPWRGVALLEASDGSVREAWGVVPYESFDSAATARATVRGMHLSIANESGMPGYVEVSGARAEHSGVLVVFADANALVNVLAPDSGLGPSGQIRLIEPDSGIAWAVSASAAKINTASLDRELLSGGLTTISSPSGPVLALAKQAPGSSLWTVAAISREEAFADLSYLRWWIVGSGTAVMAATLLLSTVFGRSMTAPLRRLMAGVAGLREGSAPDPVPVVSRDEIGLLTKEFNRMATELHDKEQRLIKSNAEVVAANEAKSQFLSTVTHELKTPLTSVIAFADLLARPGSDLGARQLQQIDAIRRNGKQLEMLINDLLDISRIQAGTLKLEVTECNLSDLIRQVIETMGPIMEDRSQVLKINAPDTEITAKCDSGRIVQVLTNLLSNASKYSPDGSAIEIEVAVDNAAARIVVRDSGIGISEEDQKRLFTPFFRADNLQTKSVPGTGLGLVIAKRLTELHGGTITLRSEVANGSEFTVTLPLINSRSQTTSAYEDTGEPREDAA